MDNLPREGDSIVHPAASGMIFFQPAEQANEADGHSDYPAADTGDIDAAGETAASENSGLENTGLGDMAALSAGPILETLVDKI